MQLAGQPWHFHVCQLQKHSACWSPFGLTNQPQWDSETPAACFDRDLCTRDFVMYVLSRAAFSVKKEEKEGKKKKKAPTPKAAAHCTADPAGCPFGPSLAPSHRAYLQTTWASAVAVIWHTPSLHTPTSGGGGVRWEGQKEGRSEREREEWRRRRHYSKEEGGRGLLLAALPLLPTAAATCLHVCASVHERARSSTCTYVSGMWPAASILTLSECRHEGERGGPWKESWGVAEATPCFSGCREERWRSGRGWGFSRPPPSPPFPPRAPCQPSFLPCTSTSMQLDEQP